jgi:hypothetical protein
MRGTETRAIGRYYEMITKKVAAIAAAAVLAAGVGVYGIASAYGGGHGHFHGRGHGGGLFLLAKAAGITHTDIRTAFQNDATKLQADHAALKTAHENFINCLLSSSNTSATSCSTQASALVAAKQTAETDKLALWEGLFASAPNKAAAANLLTQLQQLQAQRKADIQAALGTNAGSSDTPASSPSDGQ